MSSLVKIVERPRRANAGLFSVCVVSFVLVAPSAFAWPDLRIVKGGPAQAAPGEVITYTLSYSNRGPVKSTIVVMKDFLPPNSTVLTNSLNGGSLSGSTISWSLGTLNPNVAGSRSFQVRVNTNALSGSSITNRSQIFGKEAEENGKTNDNYSTRITAIVSSNRAPVAQNDNYIVAEDGTLTIAAPGVLGNDSDLDGDALTAILVNGPAHGTLTLNPNGSFSYTPAANYFGPDSFTYRANDGTTNSGIVTVTFNVTPVNDAPVAQNDNYEVAEDVTLNIPAPGVLANDTDPDADVLTAILVANPTHGTLTLNPDGSFTYRANTNYTGVDSFTYRANDGTTNSEIVTLTFNVTPVNDAPIAQADGYTVSENTALTVAAPGVLTNDSDPDGDLISAVIATLPGHGQLSLNSNGGFIYTPNTNFNGLDTFTYRISDSLADSAAVTVTILVIPTNDPPNTNQWSGSSFTAYEDTPLNIAPPGVLAGIVDADGDLLTVTPVVGTSHGTLSLSADGSFNYVPATNYFGEDSFQFIVSDGQTNSGLLTASITVIPVNDAPSLATGGNLRIQQNAGPQVVAGWAFNISPGPTNESSQSVTFLVTNNLSALFVSPPALSADGTLTYTAASGVSGTASVTVRARDNGGSANGGVDISAPQTFSITVNAPPTVQIASPTNGASFFVPGSFTVLADALDADGSIVKVEFFSGTNKVGEAVSGTPFFTVLTNLPVGIYVLSARATDDFGATAASVPVTVSVIERPPLTLLTTVYYNPQKDFFEQRVRVTNLTYSTLNAVRVLVFNLTNVPAITVGNPSGFTNGIPYVQSYVAVPPGGHVDLTIEYLSPLRILPNPILRAELVPPTGPAVLLSGTFQRINRGLWLANRTFLVEFATVSNRVYAIQYSADLLQWKNAQPAVPGTGNWAQWIDNGLPKTEAPPADAPARFYRVIQLP